MKKLRQFIVKKLFKTDLEYLENGRKNLEAELSKAEDKRLAFDRTILEWRNGQSISDLVRQQLHGFNPKMLDDENSDVLELVKREGKSEDEFLGQMAQISKMWGWKFLTDYIIREQVLHSAKSAPDLNAINFGRATVNGVSLAREEVDRLAGIQAERTAPAETFDKHQAT